MRIFVVLGRSAKARHQRNAERPLKGLWARKAPGLLEGELLGEILTQPSLGTGRPSEISQVAAHLLDEFHFLIQEVVLQEVRERRFCEGRTRACRVQGPGSGSFP